MFARAAARGRLLGARWRAAAAPEACAGCRSVASSAVTSIARGWGFAPATRLSSPPALRPLRPAPAAPLSPPFPRARYSSLPDSVTLPDGRTLYRPIEPEPDECCGNNCEDCVWTVYADDLKAYRAALAKARGQEPPADPFQALERKVREAEEMERMQKMERDARERAEKVKEKAESEGRGAA